MTGMEHALLIGDRPSESTLSGRLEAEGAIPAHSQRMKLAIDRLSDSCLFVRQGFSDVADVRQHLLAEQFERFHQCVGVFRARGLERQIDDAAVDLCAGLFQLLDDVLRPAAEIDRQRPVDIGRPPPLAGDVAFIDFQQSGGGDGVRLEHRLP
jgi:hypothetical protein